VKYRMVDDSNYYRMLLDFYNDTVSVVKMLAGSLTTLATTAFALDTGTFYQVELRTEKEKHTILIDGEEILAVTDYDVRGGTIKYDLELLSGTDAECHLDVLTVTDPRTVMAQASDRESIERWGRKEEVIVDPSVTRSKDASRRADLELSLRRFEAKHIKGQVMLNPDLQIYQQYLVDFPELSEYFKTYSVLTVKHNLADMVTEIELAETIPEILEVIKRSKETQILQITKEIELIELYRSIDEALPVCNETFTLTTSAVGVIIGTSKIGYAEIA